MERYIESLLHTNGLFFINQVRKAVSHIANAIQASKISFPKQKNFACP